MQRACRVPGVTTPELRMGFNLKGQGFASRRGSVCARKRKFSGRALGCGFSDEAHRGVEGRVGRWTGMDGHGLCGRGDGTVRGWRWTREKRRRRSPNLPRCRDGAPYRRVRVRCDDGSARGMFHIRSFLESSPVVPRGVVNNERSSKLNCTETGREKKS
jgi:hypothetical protein